MRINFRQGIVTYPVSNNNQTFLIPNKKFISLLATINDRVEIAFAHKDTDYLLTENISVTNAWGPFNRGIDYWLYWDIDRHTGIRTFGSTTLEPIVSSTEPTKVTNQHWFDTTNNTMFVCQTDGWREVIRVFAAKVNNDNFFPLGDSVTHPFAGSQVGLNTPTDVGHILLDEIGDPISLSTGVFLTTVDDIFTNEISINNPLLESNIIDVSAKENVAKFQVVKFVEFGKVNIASYTDLQASLIGLTLSDMLLNDPGKVCLSGLIINPAWNFSNIGGSLWVTDNGLLTETDLHLTDPAGFPDKKLPIGQIISPTSIIFGQGLGDVGPTGETQTSLPLATEAVQGIAKLSVPAVDPLNPIMVETNDPRLIPYVHPATHPATMITTNTYNFLTGLNVQAQLQQLVDRPLDSLSDVTTAGVISGDVLVWNGTQWAPSASGVSQYLNELLDVTLTSPTANQSLVYNGVVWNNVTPSVNLTGDLLGTGATPISTTLATVNPNVGTFGDATHVAQVTVNAKGLVTSAVNVPIAASGSGIASIDAKTGGPIWGWGNNGQGQLGTGDKTNRPTPTILSNKTNWKSIATTDHTLAIQENGTLWTTGYNASGELGLNDTIHRSSLVQIGTDTTWLTAIPGDFFSAATKVNGTAWIWGRNNFGQLGLGDTVNRSVPTQVGSLTNWRQISCGYDFATAIKTDGTLWAWGRNQIGPLANNPNGNLGLGDINHRSSPTQVGALTNWAQISNGYGHAAAVKTDGTLWAWGWNFYGQLGDGTTTNKSSPIQIGALTNWSSISCGYRCSAAIKTDGTLWTWGWNDGGVLGTGVNGGLSSPSQIGAEFNWKHVCLADKTLFAIRSDDTLWVAGYNQYGQLGLRDFLSSAYVLTQIGILSAWELPSVDSLINYIPFESSISLVQKNLYFTGGPVTTTGTLTLTGTLNIAEGGTSATTSNDAINNLAPAQNKEQYLETIWGWGANGFGQLGNGTLDNTSSPMQMGLFTEWKQINSGLYTTVALKYDGTLWAWGDNSQGQFGNGTTISTRVPVQINQDVKTFSCGYLHTAVIKTNGTLWMCGDNFYGQLGDGTTVDKSSPVQIGTGTNWEFVHTNGRNTVAIKSTGTLWMWGNNDSGQLGISSITPRSSPVQIGASTLWKQASVGVGTGAHTLAVKTDGTLWSWGANTFGELGSTTTTPRSSPVQVGALTNWSQVSAGFTHSAAVKTDGTLWTWGANTSGQLGTNNTTNQSSPVQVGSLTMWTSVHAGTDITYALQQPGTAWAWGFNNVGQLGNNSTVSRSSPIQIGTLFDWYQITGSAGSSSGIRKTANLYGEQSNWLSTDGQDTSWSPIYTTPFTNAWMWGRNGGGCLGYGGTRSQISPVQVIATDVEWKELACGYQHSIGIKADGTMWAWGSESSGRLGNGRTTSNQSIPIQIGMPYTWLKVAAGDSSSAAIRSDGTLWTWGSNTNGNLGLGDTVTRSIPTQVGSLTNWAFIDAYAHAAIKTDGTLWTWGANGNGLLGLGDIVNRSSPTQVGSLTDWEYVVSAGTTMAAVKTDGTLWTWGDNVDGQLGLGDTVKRSSPVQVGALTDWKQVTFALIDSSTAAVKTDGTLWTWGSNAQGTLGFDIDSAKYSSPVQVGSLHNWKEVRGHWNYISALKTDGTLWEWGFLGYPFNFWMLASSPIQVGTLDTWTYLAPSTGTLTAALQVRPPSVVIPVANGGTGEVLPTNLLPQLIPSQTGQAGKVLSTTGSNLVWLPTSSILP